MTRVTRSTLIAVGALLALLLPGVTARAADGELSGTVSRLPRGAQAGTVRAVAAPTGRVVAMAPLGASRRYRFSVAHGFYILAAGARARGISYGVTSPVQRVRAGRVTHVGLGVRPVRFAKARSGPALARVATLGPDSVVTVQDVVINGAPGAGIRNLQLDSEVLYQLFDPCSSQGVRFVDRSRGVLMAQQVEQKLKDTGRGAADFNYNPLAPQYQIEGEGVASADGTVTVVLNLVDLSTGALVAHRSASGRLNQLHAVIADVADQFAQEECGVPAKTRCPRVQGTRLACVTSIQELSNGVGTVTQTINQGSCPDPQGYSRAAATSLSWHYTWPETAILSATPGGRGGPSQISAAYRVDAMCGLNNEHCSSVISTIQGLDPWTGTGTPGHWRITIPALAAVSHDCSTSAIDDPFVRMSAVVTTTLRGRPDHPRPRSQTVPFSLRKTFACGPGCQDSYSLPGRIVITGEW